MSFDPVSFAMGKAAAGSGGTDVSDTTAVAADVLAGKYFHTADGTKTQGAILSKTSADISAADNVVTVPAGCYASQATKTVGTAQAAQTITPGTTDQTIAAGKYLTGAQTIKGDANLLAENIKQGVVIFGVTGTYAPTPTGHTVTFSVYNGDKNMGYGEAYFKFDTVPSSNSDYDFHVYGGYDGASPNVYGSIVPGGEEDFVEDGSQYTGAGQTLYCWGNDLYAHVAVNGSDIALGTWQSPTVIQLSADTAVSVTADSFDD